MNVTWLYSGAVYAIAVWLARRAGVAELRWRIAAFFYLLVLIFLWKPMTGAWVNLPIDIVEILPPWSGWVPKHRIANFEMNDIAMQIVPWAHQVREAWKSFTLPLWNAQAGSGYPLLANGQSSAFSLVRLLALPLPLGYAMTAEAAWKILIALTFTFLYCRRRGWGELPSAIGAICFGWCTFVQTWLHFPLVTVAVWIPAAFLMADLLLERITWPRFLTATGVWAVMLFGGHPETVSHVAFFVTLYVVWVLAVERPLPWRDAGRAFVAIAGAIAVSALIAAPFIAPFAEAITKSKRYQELQVRPNEIGYYSDLPSEVILFQPHFFGHVPYERPWGPAVAESITGFAGVLGLAAWFALLLRAIVRRRFRDRELFFVVATLIVLGIMLAWPGVSTVFHLIFKLAANARLRLMLCWLLAVMAAGALDMVLRASPRAKGSFAVYAAQDDSQFLLFGCLVASAALLWLMTTMPFPGEWEKSTAMMAILPSMIVLALATLFALPLRFRPAAMMLVGVAVIAELWSASEGWNPNIEAARMYPTTPLIARLEQYQRGWARAPFRIVGLGPAFFPNAHALFGVEDVRVHDPMANGRYLGFLRTTFNFDTDDYFQKWDDPDTRVLDLANVRYVVTDPRYEMKDTLRYRLVYQGKDGRIYENRDVLPRFWTVPNVVLEFKGQQFIDKIAHHTDWAHTAMVKVLPVESDRMRQDLLAPRPPTSPQATLRITAAKPTDFRMHVSAPRWTLAVSSIPWWPGWHVSRNGTEIEPQPVNGPFLGWTVPPGQSEFRVWYAPATFYGGAAASLLTMAALAALATRSRIRRRRAAAR
jgi:hypothetical protein